MNTNKIKQIRTRLSLSQRELAERVGTSQQQIQRIEVGKITTSLALANSICGALGKPLDVVFPKAAKALEGLRREVEENHILTDEALSKASRHGVEADANQWTFKVVLKGRGEPLIFAISASEKRRLYSAVQGEDSGSLVQFAVFDTEDSRIALNLSEVTFCQFLFDPLNFIVEKELVPEEGKHECDVLITMIGGGPAIQLFVDVDDTSAEDGIGQLGHVFYMMESEADPSDRYRIVDADGEDAFIRAGSVALLQVSLWALGEDDGEDVQ